MFIEVGGKVPNDFNRSSWLKSWGSVDKDSAATKQKIKTMTIHGRKV